MSMVQPQPAGLPSGTIGHRRRTSTTWQWRRLVAAPHRISFWAAGLVMGFSALWWGVALAAKAAGLVLPWAVESTVAHALLMGFGFLPLFAVGFLFSAGPRWLGLAPVPARLLGLPVTLVLAGWALALAGFHASRPVAALGLAVAAVGLALCTGLFGLLVLESRQGDAARDLDHAVLSLVGSGLTVLALWAAAVLLALGRDEAVRAVAAAALWAGPGLVLAAVAHSALPQLAAPAPVAGADRRPRVLLGLLAVLMALQAVFGMAEALVGGWPDAVAAGLRAALELPAGAALLALTLRAGLMQAVGRRPEARLPAMLHLGFAWLGVAFTLAGVSHALIAGTVSATGSALSLGVAPLHAFTMGFFGSLLLALATQVARSQSGRAVVADNWVWMMFWALEAAVAARVAAALWPAAGTPLTLLAAQLWLAAMGAWVFRHLPWFGRPRPDGGMG